MSLGRKIFILFLVLGVCFSCGTFMALKLAVYPTFEDFEKESMEATLSRTVRTLEADLHALEIMNIEYSLWDHTYDYALGNRPEYAQENLDPANWQSIDIHMMLIFDAQGRMLYGSLQNPVDGSTMSLEDEFLQPLKAGHPLVTHETLSDSVSGLLRTRSGIMQVVSFPILTSQGEGPTAGSFVVAQFLTTARVAEIGQRATANLSLHFGGTADEPPQATALLLGSVGTPGSRQSILFADDNSSVRGYQSVQDIFGKPIAVFEAHAPHRITQIGAHTIRTVTLMLAAISAIFLLTASLFMRRLIIAPLKKLTDQILDIRQTGDLQIETEDNRFDEVGVLAGEFSAMTQQVGNVQKTLEHARDEALATARSKSEFMARMSHEIRTPMNGVLGMTELLRDTSLDSKQRRFADTIYDSADSLLRIINDILDFSKAESGKLRLDLVDVHLRAVVEETVEGLAAQAHVKGIELMTMVPPGLNALVQADPVRLRQVLTNLVGNAIKFTDQGEVVVKLNASEGDAGSLNVRFEVRDTGIGIACDQQENIFDSFTQADGTTTRLYGGTGLGLAICKQLIGQMGGKLAVKSNPGQGAVFSFGLRLQTSCNSVAPASAQMHCVAGQRVLVVDDNATNREILEHQLSSWRASVDSASSAEKALNLLVSAVAQGTPYDLVILDMHMPRADGLELARTIRANQHFASLKLVILSSVATPASEDILRQLDIAGQLTKPVRQSQLYDALAIIMGGKTVLRRHSSLSLASARRLHGRILVAEDNPVNQAVALGMLESLGLEVEFAENGCEAVEKYSAESFDAVLMDCQMPLMDGFNATKLIRKAEGIGAQTPIIAVTANALTGDREQCLAAGMNEYLTKPFTSEQLHAVLALFLRKPVESFVVDSRAEVQAQQCKAALQEIESPIDMSTLNRLASLQQSGTPNLMHKVMSIYIQSSGVIKDRLGNAINAADAAVVRESAHALKSSSMNVGATGLADLCKHLESMGRDEDLGDGPTIIGRLDAEYARVVSALQTELKVASA